jgi:hypothetical protein
VRLEAIVGGSLAFDSHPTHIDDVLAAREGLLAAASPGGHTNGGEGLMMTVSGTVVRWCGGVTHTASEQRTGVTSRAKDERGAPMGGHGLWDDVAGAQHERSTHWTP